MGSTSDALCLYRSLLRYSKRLELTDKDYFRRRIRKEFELNRNSNVETAERQLKRGVKLLELNKFV